MANMTIPTSRDIYLELNGKKLAVVQGDTLWAIAARNGTTVRALCALNPQIANPNRIYPGERVRLS